MRRRIARESGELVTKPSNPTTTKENDREAPAARVQSTMTHRSLDEPHLNQALESAMAACPSPLFTILAPVAAQCLMC